MKKNVAGQKIGAQLITAADGTEFTGSVTVSVTGDAGTQATGSVGSGACAHEGHGYHTYAPAQAETNYDLVAYTFYGTGAITVTVQAYTDNLPTAAPGAAGGLFIAGTNAATSITTALTANIIGNITGALSGAVGSVTGAVGSVTGLTPGNLDAAVSTRATPAQILTTALTESYAADGAAPTLSQLMFLIQQILAEASIVTTTMTVKKLDGSTTAATFTINSASAPTSITRTT